MTNGLSEFLQAANRGGLSAREVARRARARGHTLNHDTAARYLNGNHGAPEETTLVAFADVLDIPLKQLREAAGLPTDTTDPYVPPREASRLTRRQRRAVDEVIRSMLEPTGRRVAPTELDPRRTGATHPTPRAARHGEPEPPADQTGG